jgi:hypothetical protein
MRTVPEKTKVHAELRFLDRNDRPFTPTTVRYRVKDRASDTMLQDWTVFTPSTVVQIAILPEVNRILNDRATAEVRVLTVQSDHDTENQLSQEVEYRVTNLLGFQ